MAMAQMMSEKSALKSIRLARYEKANKQVRKLLSKDSTNAVAQYVLATYYFVSQNPAYNIDSAYRYTMTSWRNFSNASPKSRERMKRFPLDSTVLIAIRMKIDSTAFERARTSNTEESYSFFLSNFPYATAREQAIELRHEAAFKESLKKNTREAFRYFLDQYPQAPQIEIAKIHYEKLLFDHETKSRRWEDYQKFVRQYPNSPHREEAIQKIFLIRTASGEVSDYQSFINEFGVHLLSKRAQSIIDHLDITDADSSKSSGPFLIPILHDGKFGFMNTRGEEVIKPTYDEIDASYKCGNITDQLLAIEGRAVSSIGLEISAHKIDQLEPLGNGFWLAGTDNCVRVIHQSGFSIGDDCIDDAKVIAGKYLALKKGSAWTLWAMNGLRITEAYFDNLMNVGDVVVFQKDGRFRFATTRTVAVSANQQPLKLSDPFDEFKTWQPLKIWLRAGQFEGVVDQGLNVFIGFERGNLEQTFFGAKRATTGIQLYDDSGNKTMLVNDVQLQKPWVIAKTAQDWLFRNESASKLKHASFDTVRFAGPFVVAIRNDSTTIFFDQRTSKKLTSNESFEFIPGQDSSAYLVINTPKSKTLYDQRGRKVFTFVGDKIQHAGQQYFIVFKRDKKGLIGPGGKNLTPIEFDAIGSLRNGSISLLKSMRFGMYDVRSQKVIVADYAKNVVPYNKECLTAFKNGAWGFIDWKNKPIGKFEFEEIQYWNDSLALVKKNTQWLMIELKSQRVLFEGIKELKFIRDTPAEKLAIIEQDKKFGVISNRKGIVIPLNFSDLVNVGSAEEPIFFTEKHVEEASVFVVIYYSSEGKFLRKEVYEAEDYERIYCAE